MSNKVEKMEELEKKILEIITELISCYWYNEIYSWSAEDVEKAMAYIESDDYTDEDFLWQVGELADIVLDDIMEKAGVISPF